MNGNEVNATPKARKGARHTFVVVLLAILAALWLIWGPVGPVLYVGGLFNSTSVWLFVSLAVLLLVLPAIVSVPVLPVLLAYTLITWRRQSPRARLSLLLGTAAIGGLVVPIIVGFTGLTASPFDMYVWGFARHVKMHTDIVAIQNWLDTLNPKEFTDSYGSVEKCFAIAEQPLCIARLHPKSATVQPDDSGHLAIKLLWGGGFIGHWGIVVGRKDMPLPPSDISKSGVQYFPLAPGAYIWSGD